MDLLNYYIFKHWKLSSRSVYTPANDHQEQVCVEWVTYGRLAIHSEHAKLGDPLNLVRSPCPTRGSSCRAGTRPFSPLCLQPLGRSGADRVHLVSICEGVKECRPGTEVVFKWAQDHFITEGQRAPWRLSGAECLRCGILILCGHVSLLWV